MFPVMTTSCVLSVSCQADPWLKEKMCEYLITFSTTQAVRDKYDCEC